MSADARTGFYRGPKLILASGSKTRALLLRQAGMPFSVQAAAVDEGAIKQQAKREGLNLEATAQRLADTKATASATQNAMERAAFLGGDQMLGCGEAWLDKAESLAEAAEQLRFLRGKTHRLVSAAALVVEGQVVWRGLSAARMRMRDLSEGFIAEYVGQLGETLLQGVGCYAIEGLGIHLFEEIDGDAATIMGLPLLPLLGEFRRREWVLA